MNPSKRFGLAILIFVVAGSLFFVELKDGKAIASAVSREELRRLTRLAVSEHEILIDQTRQVLLLMSKLPQVRERDISQCNEILASLLVDEKRFLNFGVVNLNGELMCSALPFEKGLNVSDRAYFIRAMETGGFAVGDYQIGRVTQQQSVNFGYAFKDDTGQILGISFAALGLDWLQHFLERANLPSGSELIITDSKGIVLAHYPRNGIGTEAKEVSFPFDRLEYIEQGLGILETRNAEGKKIFLVAAPLKLEDQEGFLHLIISVSKSSISR